MRRSPRLVGPLYRMKKKKQTKEKSQTHTHIHREREKRHALEQSHSPSGNREEAKRKDSRDKKKTTIRQV